MASAELTSTQAPQEPAADRQAPWPGGLHRGAGGHQADGVPPAHPGAAGREAGAQPRADRRRGPAAVHATARWLRRALADSARAWALAAGVPPDLYH
jgi:hypothetical protein